jgi:hypothetical protein
VSAFTRIDGEGMTHAATFSPCEVYRYTLERVWQPELPRLLWVLLNPSTATEKKFDPTNTKGMNFSIAWGFGACVFVNLFAFRSPHPKVMRASPIPIGPDNDKHILEQAELAGKVVVAWGNDGRHWHRDQAVLKLLKGIPLYCMGTNQNGSPKHPLYLANKTQLIPFGVK